MQIEQITRRELLGAMAATAVAFPIKPALAAAGAVRKVWIEVALNGPWSRALQPGIPDTVEAIIAEGIACARAGAAIIHTHAYDGGGRQTFDWQVYARIIEGIRAKVDAPIYPSYPSFMIGSGAAGNSEAEVRFSPVDALASRGLIEFVPVDPGSVNLTRTATTSQADPADTYVNPESHVRHALGIAKRYGLHPAFAIYEPGFIRAGAALARATGVKTPIYRSAIRAHLAEFGIVAPVGRQGVEQLLGVAADTNDKRLPEIARACVAALGAQLRTLKAQILQFDRMIRAWHRSNEESRRLDDIPGVGPALATALVASVADPRAFRSGRDFSAWIGLVPKQNSSGGKDRLGNISKRGDRYLRSLLTTGALAVIRYRKPIAPGIGLGSQCC